MPAKQSAPTRFTHQLDPKLPMIAVDLGYSAQQKSCGLASTHGPTAASLGFGECISEVVELMRAHGRHTLILEAVLSTYHRPDGNPEIRGSFEKGRGWYHGPGVTTFAAALRFLSELDRRLPKSLHPIPLVEGFLSYKPARTTHEDDARRILLEFEQAERFQAAEGSEPIAPFIAGLPEIRRYNRPK
jgi:hypothetical protein